MSDEVRNFNSNPSHVADLDFSVHAESRRMGTMGPYVVRLSRETAAGMAVVLEVRETALREFLDEVDAARKKGGA